MPQFSAPGAIQPESRSLPRQVAESQMGLVHEQRNQNDDGDGNAEKEQK